MKFNIKRKKAGMSIPKFNTLLLILLSFFYLQSNSTLSIIIITIPLVMEVMFIVMNVHSISGKNSVFIGIAIIIYTVFTQLLLINNAECLSFVFSVLYFILAHNSIRYLSKEDMLFFSKLLLIFGIVLLTMDTIWRFTHPVYSDFYTGVYWFYRYKSKGILFVDTNNTGMLCLAILSFLLYLNNKLNIKFRKITLVYIILLVLTFSRSSLLAYALTIVFLNKRFPKYLKVLAFLGGCYVAFLLLPSLFDDVSTSSKFDMFLNAVEYWKEASLFEILFGVGFTNSIYKIGLFTHSWPLTFTFEFGFLGFLLIVLFWYLMYKESNKSAAYVLIPCLFAGLSYLPLLIPYVYTLVVIITMLEKKKEALAFVN